MKNLFITLIVTLILSTQVYANDSVLTCSNGDISTMGDSLIVVKIYEDGLEILPYESGFIIDPFDAEFNVNSDTIYVMDKTVRMTSEGTEFDAVIDAIIILNADETEMFLTYSTDKGTFKSYELTCVINN